MRGQSTRDGLERIAKMRRIKNYEKMSKEVLIISLLKSKQSIAKLFNINLGGDKISDIGRILKKAEKEESDEYLRELVRILSKKEEHGYYDRDDLDYYGIRDI